MHSKNKAIAKYAIYTKVHQTALLFCELR